MMEKRQKEVQKYYYTKYLDGLATWHICDMDLIQEYADCWRWQTMAALFLSMAYDDDELFKYIW